MKATKLSAIIYLLWHLAPATLFAQMPQDRWVFNGQLIQTNVIGGSVFGSLYAGADGNIYALTGDGTAAYGLTVNLNCGFAGPAGQAETASAIAVDAYGNVYAIVKPATGGGGAQVQQFYRSAYQQTIGSPGFFNPSILINPVALAVGHDGYLYVADAGSSSVYKFYDYVDHSQWTNGLGATNAFPNITSIAQLPDGNFCTAYNIPGYSTPAYPNLQIYGPGGNFVTNLLVQVGGSPALSVTPDGLVGLGSSYPDFVYLVQPNLGPNPLNTFPTTVAPPSFAQFTGASPAFDSNGTMFVIVNITQPYGGMPVGSTAVAIMSRVYGSAQTADVPLSIIPPPAPLITSVQQRPGTSLVDITYNVSAATNQVTTELVAFQNGVEDFRNLVLMPPSSFTNNGASHIGANVAANVTNTVTWDSSTGITNFASLAFDIMAKDQRPLLNIHFITVPANQTQPALTVSSYAYRDSDYFNLWLWLLATNNPSIKLTNGAVVGVGGTYDQQLLAGTNITSPQGLQFLYQLLHVRALTQAEYTQAQSGHYGILYLDPNYSLVKLP